MPDKPMPYDPKRTITRPPGTPRNVLGLWTRADGYRYFDDLTKEEIKDITNPPDLKIDYVKVWQ